VFGAIVNFLLLADLRIKNPLIRDDHKAPQKYDMHKSFIGEEYKEKCISR